MKNEKHEEWKRGGNGAEEPKEPAGASEHCRAGFRQRSLGSLPGFDYMHELGLIEHGNAELLRLA